MQVNLLNKPNIPIPKPNYQTDMQNQMLNSVNYDVFIKSKISFTGINPVEILNDFEKFGIIEYKTLSKQKIEALRDSLSSDTRLIKARNAAIILGNTVKTNLDKIYNPNKYVLISIGRSPAVIGKAIEYQGVDVRYCPISEIGNIDLGYEFKDVISYLESEKVSKYNEYLKSVNLSNDKIKQSNKTFIFTDHSPSGQTLKNFRILLERPEIGIKAENVHYKNLTSELILNEKELDNLTLPINFENLIFTKEELIDYYIRNQIFKVFRYPHIRRLPYNELEKIQSIIDSPQHNESKQMQFALIDYFAQKGLLKE